jgi:hypothetical protein
MQSDNGKALKSQSLTQLNGENNYAFAACMRRQQITAKAGHSAGS